MNISRLCDIIGSTTLALPTATPEHERNQHAMDHFLRLRTAIGLPRPEGVISVYCYFFQVAVDTSRALEVRGEVVTILADWPELVGTRKIPELPECPTHTDISAVLGTDQDAYGLLALGVVLGFWEVNTPETYGYSAGTKSADNAARNGYVRTTRYTSAAR